MILLSFLLALQTSSPSYRVIDKGAQSGVDDAQQIAVRTADEWAKVWQRHGLDRPRPKVDFAREIVVGVFMGSRPTAGFEVEIAGVASEGGVTVVRYRETAPSRDAITAQVITSPYVLAAIPRTSGDVRFEKVQ